MGACALFSLAAHACSGRGLADGDEGIREALGAEVQGAVLDFAWEPQRSLLAEWVWGRPVLFLLQRENSPRELFRGFVRMSPEGSPLEVSRVRNLSRTDLADEDTLSVGPRLAAFRSRDLQGHSTVGLLELAGAEAPSSLDLLERLQLGLTRFLEFGDVAGLGRTDLVLSPQTQELNLKREGEQLVIATRAAPARTPSETVRRVTLSRLFTGPEDIELGEALTALKRRAAPPPLLHWAADVGRTLVGPGPIAWLEAQVFGVRDWFVRTQYAATHAPPAQPAQSTPAEAPKLQLVPPPDEPSFPPPPIVANWSAPKPGEGSWHPAGESLTLSPGEPPLFYRTLVRPDPERPYAEHHLVVMDMSRLELGLRGGYEDPRPRTGPPGSGHIPKDEASYSRIVATFNGAFKLDHGAYGMKAEGRVLIPPIPGAATVRIDPDGRVGIGAAPAADPSGAPLLEDAVAYRQNLDLLLHHGKLLPTGRTDWGDHLVGSSVAAERSALCVTQGGHLIYSWSMEATARTLARGLQLAGCRSAIHLDMNPGHCAFAFNRVQSFQPLRAEGEALSPGMRINANRFLRWSPKDFFYVARRSSLPEGKQAAKFDFRPAPASRRGGLPAVLLGKKNIAGIELEVERIDLERVQLSLLPHEGAQAEPSVDSLPPGAFAWSLGYATAGSRTGLSMGATQLRPMDRKFASIVLGAGNKLSVEPPGAPVESSAATQIAQLPLLARDGALTDSARRLTGQRLHGALCLDSSGHLLIGRLLHDSPAPLVLALLELGCQTVLETDRGSHSPAVSFRPEAPASSPPADPGTLLVAELRHASGRAYEF